MRKRPFGWKNFSRRKCRATKMAAVKGTGTRRISVLPFYRRPFLTLSWFSTKKAFFTRRAFFSCNDSFVGGTCGNLTTWYDRSHFLWTLLKFSAKWRQIIPRVAAARREQVVQWNRRTPRHRLRFVRPTEPRSRSEKGRRSSCSAKYSHSSLSRAGGPCAT